MTPPSTDTPNREMNPTAAAILKLVCHEQREHASDQCEGNCSDQKERIAHAAKRAVEQEEDDQEADWHDDFEPRNRGLKFLKFSRPFVVISGRQLYLLR